MYPSALFASSRKSRRSFSSPPSGIAAHHQSYRNQLGKSQPLHKLFHTNTSQIDQTYTSTTRTVWFLELLRLLDDKSVLLELLVCKKAACQKSAPVFFIPGPNLTTRMLPGSPCPLRYVDEAKNSGNALGSHSLTCLHASHIASGEASKTSLCDKVLLDNAARSRVLNTRTALSLMYTGGPASPTGSYFAVQTTFELVSSTGTNIISALKELYWG